MRSSVTRWGVTWTFSASCLTGQFCNGDWWVVRPCTVTSITPSDADLTDFTAGVTTDYNGATINPGPFKNHGFCNGDVVVGTSSVYARSANVARQLPYTVPVACSIGSVIHKQVYADYLRDQTFFDEFSVLTCLDAEPASDAFRPPYAGNDKTIKANWHESSINYGALRTLPVPSPLPPDYPSITYLEACCARPLLDFIGDSHVNTTAKAAFGDMALDGTPTITGGYPVRNYGMQKVGPIAKTVGCWLNLNISNATKRKTLIDVIQWGIDNTGLVRCGMQWLPFGGHNVGREIPSIVAGKCLNDSEILATLAGNFNIQFNYFTATQADVDYPRLFLKDKYSDTTRQLVPFTTGDIGKSFWAFANWGPPSPAYGQRTPQLAPIEDAINTNYYNFGYMYGNVAANFATVLVAQAMGARSDFAAEEIFRASTDTFWPVLGTGEGLVQSLWPLIMAGPPPCVIAPGDGTYESPVTVTVTSEATGATIYYTTNGTNPTTGSAVYSAPFQVTGSGIKDIRAVAYDAGAPSPITQRTFTVDATGAPAPVSGFVVTQA